MHLMIMPVSLKKSQIHIIEHIFITMTTFCQTVKNVSRNTVREAVSKGKVHAEAVIKLTQAYQS